MSENQQFAEPIDLGGDYSHIEAWDGASGPKVDPGEYTFKVAAAEAGMSSNGTMPLINIRFEVTSEGPFKGTVIRQSYTISTDDRAKTASIGRLRQLYNALQMEWNNKIDVNPMPGREFIGEVIHEEYQKADGRTGEAVTKVGVRVKNERPHPSWKPPGGTSKPQRRAS